jgi:uncharacterized protein with FMN-binding domain
MNNQRATYPLAIFAGLSLVGALAGCSSAAGETTPSSDSNTSDSSATEAPTTDATETPSTDTAAGAYTDGTYEASGDYTDGGGQTETLDVSITLAGDVITAVEVTGDAKSPTSERYQSEFIGGIADVVVGKSIDAISVDKVAGSSLTSGGFNEAVEEIKADAAA